MGLQREKFGRSDNYRFEKREREREESLEEKRFVFKFFNPKFFMFWKVVPFIQTLLPLKTYPISRDQERE